MEPVQSDWFAPAAWARDTWPVVALIESGSRGAPQRTVQIAIWQDGKVKYVEGGSIKSTAVEASRVEHLLNDLESAGVFEIPSSGYMVFDARIAEIFVRSGDQMIAHQWDEMRRADWGYNIEPTPSYQRFVEVWSGVRDHIDVFLTELVDSRRE